MKVCFSEGDTGERMFGYSRHLKTQMMQKYKYDLTDSGRQAVSFGLVFSLSHSLLKMHMYWFILYSVERNSRKICSQGYSAPCNISILASGCLAILMVSSGLNYSFLVSACWKDWNVDAGSCLVFACLDHPSAAAKSYLVFAYGYCTATQKYQAHPQRNMAE